MNYAAISSTTIDDGDCAVLATSLHRRFWSERPACMDASRFDSLARALSSSRSRRSIARLLGTLAFGGGVSAQTVREALAATRIGGHRASETRNVRPGRV